MMVYSIFDGDDNDADETKQNQPQTNEQRKMKNWKTKKRGNQTNLLSTIINFFFSMDNADQNDTAKKNSKTSLRMQNKSKAMKNSQTVQIESSRRKKENDWYKCFMQFSKAKPCGQPSLWLWISVICPCNKTPTKRKKEEKKNSYTFHSRVAYFKWSPQEEHAAHAASLYNTNSISPKRWKEISKGSSGECGFSWTGALTCELVSSRHEIYKCQSSSQVIRGRVHPVGIKKGPKRRRKKGSYILFAVCTHGTAIRCWQRPAIPWGIFFFFCFLLLLKFLYFPPFLNATAHDFAAWFSHLFASTHQPGEVLRRYEYQ